MNAVWYNNTPDYCGIQIHTTTDNSNYTEAQSSYQAIESGNGQHAHTRGDHIFDVTNTTTHKVRFKTNIANSGDQVQGNTSRNLTYFTFTRMGDT